MQHKRENIDERILEKIISVAYNDAGLLDKIKIHLLARKNPDVKKILEEYKRTAIKIKNIPLDECPDSVIESLRIQTRNENKSLFLKPAYIFAIITFIISTIIVVTLNQNNEEKPHYTKAEIELAEKQVKESLAIVNNVFKRTETLIQEEIFPKRIGKPIHKSLSIINEVLIGG